MSSIEWRPTAGWQAIKERAEMQQCIRAFFAKRDVLEVETPILARAGVTDVHLHNAVTRLQGPGMPQPQNFYLQTSPEYAMKRLLAAGSGPIFQICKVVRDDEISRRHNPEFSMLEWYRPGFDDYALMAELNLLIQQVLGCESAECLTYQQAFIQTLNIDPLDIAAKPNLLSILQKQGFADAVSESDSLDTLLQLAMSVLIEPVIGQQRPCFVSHFPASQAALARISKQDMRVSHRFELFYKGLELANGFWELADAEQQRQRFRDDNRQRKAMGLPVQPIDEHLLAALASGLPDCSGVAVGLDRLLMLRVGATDIAEVLTFPVGSA
ncbi:elongation factor P lysine(34) lysyltransferase [Aliidiomarina iranensis]|uniref:Elongation factor P lysine(34) lysyltransferase n=1 Tax=Aliidiomarina iranensis TaxID=1434071 RepID=A0A432VRX1_9GAMM|nr:elongation factor P--(R)-beta-lysine ligase [Aliidiomarina iranensis]RUO19041.1 elongation factor P lysine(34) lysyltransferase [Aliidiomarina iranensis]